LNTLSDVEYTEPNYIYNSSTNSNPLYSQLWGFKNNGQSKEGVPDKAGIDIKAESAWTKQKTVLLL
jgi:hypothetical protein